MSYNAPITLGVTCNACRNFNSNYTVNKPSSVFNSELRFHLSALMPSQEIC